ncbi:MAG: hypothetical protein KDA78_13925 [Planctomycetaceae bacterium]|nr:hypothetical protein [Planctomycetaceae bacterium]
MSITQYLQQTSIGGISLFQIAIWLFILCCVLLALLLLIRLLSWVFRTLNAQEKSRQRQQMVSPVSRAQEPVVEQIPAHYG